MYTSTIYIIQCIPVRYTLYNVYCTYDISHTIILTEIAATRNEITLSYHRVRGLYFLAVIFVVTIICLPTRQVIVL